MEKVAEDCKIVGELAKKAEKVVDDCTVMCQTVIDDPPEKKEALEVACQKVEKVADEAQAERPAAHSSGRKKWAEVDPQLQRREYSVAEAVSLIQELAVANFDESIDVVMKLGLDPRKADQQIRGMAALPHNTGKAVRLCVFAEPEQQAGLAEAGAAFYRVLYKFCVIAVRH